MQTPNVEDPVRTGWGCVLLAIAMSILLLSMSALMGCKSCEPIIEYEEVIVEVPIATDNEPLPVPDNVVCEQQDSEDWRDSALFLKECFDSLLRKIEEYDHIIRSYNETRSQ